MENGFWTVKELAQNLKIGLSKGYELINSNGFPVIRLGRRIIIPVDKLKVWLDKNLGL